MQDIFAIAHRGFPTAAPENTPASFSRALDLSPEMLECDVRRTQDGRVVVIHDATVDRTTDGLGEVAHMTLDEVKRLDAGSWFAQEFAGERIPTLEEVLDLVCDRARLVVEIKEEGLEDRVVEIAREMGCADRVLIASFHHHIGVRMPFLNEDIPFVPLVMLEGQADEVTATRVADEAANVNGRMLGVNYRSITPALLRATHAANLKLMAWTVDEEEAIRAMAETGVDAIASNRLDLLIETLESVGARGRSERRVA